MNVHNAVQYEIDGEIEHLEGVADLHRYPVPQWVTSNERLPECYQFRGAYKNDVQNNDDAQSQRDDVVCLLPVSGAAAPKPT